MGTPKPHATVTVVAVAREPRFEPIEINEIERRIRQLRPGLDDHLYRHLAIATVVCVPVPPALGEYLRQIISPLNGAIEFVEGSVSNDTSAPAVSELRGTMHAFLQLMETVRDRMYRVCTHEIETLADGRRRCRHCDTELHQDQAANGTLPPVMVLRAYSRSTAQGKQRPGRTAHLFLATQLCRRVGHTKKEALRIAGAVVDLFWADGEHSYDDDLSLAEAERVGRELSAKNHFMSADDLVNHMTFDGLKLPIIWVPYPGNAKKTTQ